jgi:hypothetical protein
LPISPNKILKNEFAATIDAIIDIDIGILAAILSTISNGRILLLSPNNCHTAAADTAASKSASTSAFEQGPTVTPQLIIFIGIFFT